MTKSNLPNWQDVVRDDNALKVIDAPDRWVPAKPHPTLSGKKFNMFTYHNVDRSGEVNTMPSNTVPSPTLSMRDLVKRHMRGQEVPGGRFTELPFEEIDGHLSEGADLPNMYRMSEMDRIDFAREAYEASKEMKSEISSDLKGKALERAKKAQERADKEAAAAADKEQAKPGSESTNNT